MKILITSIVILLASAFAAHADFTAKTAHDFVQAQATVYKTGTPESVEAFVAYMSDDVKDVHVAYGREFSGKDHFRKNMPGKAKALITYERQISDIMMGTNVAIVTYHEQTKEEKSDGRISEYSGRTIMVIDFDDAGLVTSMRRYMD